MFGIQQVKTIVTAVVGVGLTTGVIVGACEAASAKKKLNEIGIAMSDIRKKTPVEVSQEMVDKAVDDAVREKTTKAVNRAIEDAKCSIRRDAYNAIDARTSETIRALESETRGKVAESLQKKAENIDITNLRKEVRDSAARAVAGKFSGELDDIIKDCQKKMNGLIDTCNDKLESISNIYSSIEDRLTGKDKSKNITFKVGE